MSRTNKGFTLIELLVVIAIIGILASVVLASLNTARSKAVDAAVKANLAQIRTQGAIYFDAYSNYGSSAFTAGACAATANTLFANTVAEGKTIVGQIDAAAKALGTTNKVWTDMFCVSDGVGTYAVATSKNLPSAGTGWCVDSSGATKAETLSATPVVADVFSSGLCK